MEDLEQTGQQVLKRETSEYFKKRGDAFTMKEKRSEVEREIYHLENVLRTIQRKRAKVEAQNLKLEELKIERDQEIRVIHQNIKKKEDDILKSEELFKELENNINEIVKAAMEI